MLLQAAFSHNGLAEKFDGTNDGAFRTVLRDRRISGPLLITHTTLNVVSMMGLIMIVGIVSKNGILMLDTVEDHLAGGVDLNTALVQSGRRRFRPVLMTSLAAMLGMLPLALALGSGAELLQPLAIGVIGGLAFALLLSLVVTPAVYAMLRG